MTLTCGWKGYTWHPAFSRSDLILDQNILSDEILQDTINDGSVQVVFTGMQKINIISVRWGISNVIAYQQWHSTSIHLSMQAHWSWWDTQHKLVSSWQITEENKFLPVLPNYLSGFSVNLNAIMTTNRNTKIWKHRDQCKTYCQLVRVHLHHTRIPLSHNCQRNKPQPVTDSEKPGLSSSSTWLSSLQHTLVRSHLFSPLQKHIQEFW